MATLDVIRKRINSPLVKILFGLLILSFALWGVGDMVSGAIDTTDSVATVGETKVPQAVLEAEYKRELQRLAPTFGGEIKPEQARALRLADLVLQRILTRTLIDQAARDLGVTVSDAVVLQEIRNTPVFAGPTGEFDRITFEQVLAQSGLTEAQFVSLVRGDLRRAAVLSALGAGVTVPEPMFDPLYRHRQERRVAKTVLVAAEEMDGIGAPTQEQLATYHEENKQQFMAPEYRALTAVVMTPDDLMDTIAVSDEELKEAYDYRADEFTTPEKRSVQQMIFADEATANKAHERLTRGEDFATVAEEETGSPPSDLGTMTREEALSDLRDAIFSLAPGSYSVPVETPLGWHVVQVTRVDRADQMTFEDAKHQLADEIKRTKAGEALYELRTRLEDELAGGATLAEAAERLDLRLVKTEVDPTGLTPDGTAPEDFAPGQPFLQTAFATEPGMQSPVIDTAAGGYAVIRVDGVTPPALRPLDEVEARVRSAWEFSQKMDKAEQVADEMAKAVNDGADFAELAEKRGLPVDTTSPFTRDGLVAGGGLEEPKPVGLPEPLVVAVFTLDPGQAAMAPVSDGFYVAKLDAIQAAPPANESPLADQTRTELAQSLASTFEQQLIAQLERRYSVTVNRGRLESVY